MGILANHNTYLGRATRMRMPDCILLSADEGVVHIPTVCLVIADNEGFGCFYLLARKISHNEILAVYVVATLSPLPAVSILRCYVHVAEIQ